MIFLCKQELIKRNKNFYGRSYLFIFSKRPFLVSSHGPPGFHPRLQSSSSSSPTLKRTINGPLSVSNSPNTSINTNMNVSTSPSLMRSSNSMGTLKSTNVSINPMDKSNTMPYSSRYTRKAWPMSRSIHDKNIRGYDEHELPYNRSSHSVPSSDNINNSSFTIEPSIDDDEADDIMFSSRHMAAARFQRNQRLLYEIFNEICIPDLRSNINIDRILTLRRQVDALKTHRETFEKDLNELEEKHAEKKRKFFDSNEKFYHEYNQTLSTNLTQEKINEILQKCETIEKLQKEKQLLLQQQQQQQVVATPPPPPLPLPATTVSQPIVPSVTKTEPAPIVEIPQQQTPLPPVQAQLPPSQPVPPLLPSTQPIPSSLPTLQSIPNQLPSSQPLPSQLPSSQPIQSQMPPSQPQLPPPPPPPPPHPVMPPIQPPTTTPQGYPMMHPASGYPPVPGYVHSQQSQYRPAMTQRSAQYPSNVQWQQQQQWQTNAYDSRYYNPYPPNVQWQQQQQQQQQWPPQQQPSQMRIPPHQQQQPPMYANGVHYGYGSTNAAWNPNTHPPQQYGYSQNPSYDPTLVSVSQQQQYYPPPPQMHNPPQGYDYGPPPPQ
ncbi:unnamed protein product [Rotaria sordida]|uniref:Uncharacterized protein n=1 Tax=Rotaria sordida TaxID=392033 RepID=A0A814VP56_9BILA|nr:unnamed protein product [Rotaria sordida]CAF1193287.1 unnamed protein product [Rotaria sordida]